MSTLSMTTTYAGEFAGKYIAAALFSANTIEKGGIEVKPNIKFRQVVKRLATDEIIRNASCDFTSTSVITLTERILQPEEFQVNLTLCKRDFRSDWDAVSMGYSVHDKLPATFQEFLLAHVIAKIAEKTEQTIWGGVNATVGEFDGLVTLAAADAATVKVVGAVGGVTAANVVAELQKVLDAIPARVYGKEDLSIYIPQGVMRAYVTSLGGFGAAGLGSAGFDNKGTMWYNGGALSFGGVPLFMANGLAANKIIAAQKSNLWFGTSLESDMNEVKVIDMAENDGSQNVRIVMRFTAAVQYGVGSEIVHYSPV